jgi:serine/threonine protein phosphatase 1
MSRRLLVTDIHGCFQSFKVLLEQQLKLQKSDTLYLLGDYINKGPYSREVLDYLLQLQEQDYQLRLLRGNHEQLLLDTLRDDSTRAEFQEKGGHTLLRNFQISHPRELPEKYLDFCHRLEYFFALDDVLLVHAGFDFSQEDPFQDTDAMLSIREYVVDPEKSGRRPVLHGHTPTDYVQILEHLQKRTLDHYSLDAGCVYRNDPRQAHLLGFDLDAWKAYLQPNIDDSDNYQP